MARIIEAADVTEDLIEEAIEEADGWFPDSPIDWEDLIERLETSDRDFGDSMISGAIRKLQREVRVHRRNNQ